MILKDSKLWFTKEENHSPSESKLRASPHPRKELERRNEISI
jgi:hypothetical protein